MIQQYDEIQGVEGHWNERELENKNMIKLKL